MICGLLGLLIVVFIVYQLDPSVGGLLSQGFEDQKHDGVQKLPKDQIMNALTGSGASSLNLPGALNSSATKNAEHVIPAHESPMPDAVSSFKPSEGFEEKKKEGYADLGSYEGPANFSAVKEPAGCYPRDQLTPAELLPKDMGSVWAEQNPMGPGSLKGKNFLSAGALIGVNTVGQSMRNANLQVRSEPPNPQMAVSIFNQSTISPDISHRPLEIGS